MEQAPLISGDATSVTITLPFGLSGFWTLAAFGLVVLLSLAVYGLISTGAIRPVETGESRWPALPPLLKKIGLDALPRPLAWFSTVLWGVLFTAFVIGMLYVIGSLFLLDREELREKPGDLRWYLLTLTALTAALGAVVSLPFTLLRTGFNARQTLATEEGLVTDRINAAVESLGAEKTVSRIGRAVTLVDDPQHAQTIIEWMGKELPPEVDELGKQEADWQVFAESVPNLEVRVGAILALERIAKKNPDDHVQIMEILTAYIRENAKSKDADPAPEMPEEPEIGDEDNPRPVWSNWRDKVQALNRDFRQSREPRIDIQTALTVLGRRSADQREIEARWQGDDPAAFPFDAPNPDRPPYPADWSTEAHAAWQEEVKAYQAALEARNKVYRAYASYQLDLRKTDLQGYDLSGGCWRGARFEGVQMLGADLRRAQMRVVDLGGAQMQGADFKRARMQGAGLRGVQMQGATLSGALLQGADLRRAQMLGADLSGAGMQGADLRGARMQGADLRGAQLQGAVLWGAQMQDVYLGGAVFDTATDLRPATLRGAGLRSVDYTKLGIKPALLQHTFGDASAKLPCEAPEHWARDADGNLEMLDDAEFFKRWRAFQADLAHDEDG